MPLERLRNLIRGIITAKEIASENLDESLGTTPWHTSEDALTDIEAGDMVVLDGHGIRRAEQGDEPIGVALEDGMVAWAGGGRTQVRGYDSYYQNYSSQAFEVSMIRALQDGLRARGAYVTANRFQYSRFPEHVDQRAWDLLKKYMTPEQYFAFMEGTSIEKQNKAETYRVLINRSGDFTILSGIKGEGIVQASGTIRSYTHPLGDEIAAFLDWFNHKTEELIANWNCGTYGIVKEEGR